MTDDGADLLAELEADPATSKALEEGAYAQRAANLIRNMRDAAGLSQAKLAEKAGMQQARISQAENPKGPNGPTYAVMAKLADACGYEWPKAIGQLIPKTKANVTVDTFLSSTSTGVLHQVDAYPPEEAYAHPALYEDEMLGGLVRLMEVEELQINYVVRPTKVETITGVNPAIQTKQSVDVANEQDNEGSRTRTRSVSFNNETAKTSG